MNQRSTIGLMLKADAAIDLQLHTTASDGLWEPDELIHYLQREGFGLAAITDHDRPDTARSIQSLALRYGMPLLVAAEMTTSWRGELVDLLCYGFTLEPSPLTTIAQALHQSQQQIVSTAYAYCCQHGYLSDQHQPALEEILTQPSARQPHALAALVKRINPEITPAAYSQLIQASGCDLATTEIALVVEAAHQSQAICILAHPGRSDGFVCFDQELLDKLWAEVKLDGLEVDYPLHSPEQITLYREFAQKHQLLTSAGSDSHSAAKPPIRYRAAASRALLERLGIQVQEI